MAYRSYSPFRTYVPVAARRRQAQAEAKRAAAASDAWQPVAIEGRRIAATFWGATWCGEMERHGDFANRLPRGRTYVRNGSVVDLRIEPGRVRARVMGSELYTIDVTVAPLAAAKWKALVRACEGRIGSLVELLQGRFSDEVMAILTERGGGMIPLPGQLGLDCSCPDSARLCKHLAATLYGVGARLDARPELLFVLRGVAASDLVGAAASAAARSAAAVAPAATIAPAAIADVFGIALDEEPVAVAATVVASKRGAMVAPTVAATSALTPTPAVAHGRGAKVAAAPAARTSAVKRAATVAPTSAPKRRATVAPRSAPPRPPTVARTSAPTTARAVASKVARGAERSPSVASRGGAPMASLEAEIRRAARALLRR